MIRSATGPGEGPAFPALDMPALLAGNYVAPRPTIAVERIRETFSCALTVRGSDCSGIIALRQLIASLDTDRRFARALLISAPHTHWGGATIVESFESSRNAYLIGTQAVKTRLAPYSFVFSSEGPIPYEWADTSVPLDRAELVEVWDFIWRLNELVAREFSGRLPMPLGVAIDHRFKKSIWDEQIFSFAETPSEDEKGRSVVRAMVESAIRPNPAYPGKLQAAWFSAPDSEPDLNDSEVGVLLKLEKILEAEEPEEALRFVEKLESHLRSRPDPARPRR